VARARRNPRPEPIEVIKTLADDLWRRPRSEPYLDVICYVRARNQNPFPASRNQTLYLCMTSATTFEASQVMDDTAGRDPRH
jgi:hypothetical protein